MCCCKYASTLVEDNYQGLSMTERKDLILKQWQSLLDQGIDLGADIAAILTHVTEEKRDRLAPLLKVAIHANLLLRVVKIPFDEWWELTLAEADKSTSVLFTTDEFSAVCLGIYLTLARLKTIEQEVQRGSDQTG